VGQNQRIRLRVCDTFNVCSPPAETFIEVRPD
jgi:hypothetical protein